MAASERRDDCAEVHLGEWAAGVDTKLSTDGEEGGLMRCVQLPCVGAEVKGQVEVDTGSTRWWMKSLLETTQTRVSRLANSG